MIDWKEFLKEKKEAKDWGKTHIMDVSKEDDFLNRDLIYEDSIKVEDLQEFFLGEVARITKDFDKFKAKLRAESFGGNYSLLINDSKKFGRLEGQLKVYKELAGVEQ